MFNIRRWLANVDSIWIPRDRTTYDLRTGQNITNPPQRTTTYQKSFFPQTIKDWNSLEPNIRNLPSLNSFKEHFKKKSPYKNNPLFYHNCSSAAINHTRIRLGLSGLSSQRHDYHHIPTPKCPTCAARKEDPSHYFILCPTYAIPRHTFLQGICDILYQNNVDINFNSRAFRELFLKIILRGHPTLSDNINTDIFSITQAFIKDTHRFPWQVLLTTMALSPLPFEPHLHPLLALRYNQLFSFFSPAIVNNFFIVQYSYTFTIVSHYHIPYLLYAHVLCTVPTLWKPHMWPLCSVESTLKK
jgi:hypothetical protein